MNVSPYALPPLADAGAGTATGQRQRPALPRRRPACIPEVPKSFRELAALVDKRETQKMLAVHKKLKKSRSEPVPLPKISQLHHPESFGETFFEASHSAATTDDPSWLAATAAVVVAPDSAKKVKQQVVEQEEEKCAACAEAENVQVSLESKEQDRELPKDSGRAKLMWGKVKAKAQLLSIASAFSKEGKGKGGGAHMLDTLQQWRRWCNKADRGFKSPRSQCPAWKDPDFLTKEINELEERLQRDRVRMRKQMEQQVHKSKEGLKITAQHLPAVADELNAEVVSRYRKDALESIDIQGKRIREALRVSTLRRKELEVCVQTMKTTFGRQTGEVGHSNGSFLETLAGARLLQREAEERSKLLDHLAHD
eukprot:TRINITY_DN106476_c0_g1_i1.p1 TRINITY_DN106476_c0_g1~~TRINITY_DN106476_c0_g1_i1.p1  ORF type:complete len:368 (+),score=90.62 TRINITY_DN106476_c0_g1_i1:97-1200(+)